MQFFPVLLLAFAVSIDSFNVGFTYGLRKVQIPFHAIIIIACCSGLALYFASILGVYMGTFLSPSISSTVGGIILILLGIWALVQFFKTSKDNQAVDVSTEKVEKVLLKLEWKSAGIVIHILKKPLTADLDHSGKITGFEAVLLGMALSLDALGAGIGSSMLGFSPLILAITVGVMSAFFAAAGIRIGASLSSIKWIKQFSFIPGILLICIGLWKI
ncbi:sporulation membrane protein YtaF [Caldibacillus lycopersici]|uniref:Sporulation membrane protein YtaF n=1 Tax=Perspicuibacillus lycopersici TaxID=1325689 RepID=A0AAE3ITG8_9BACI|nr:sporulation membrane protein YtaF [Perspicuibacillus lycopersici]MCU9614176.1 sporulation membrane protein YtaF [Perspicuibacillus lycopersici]